MLRRGVAGLKAPAVSIPIRSHDVNMFEPPAVALSSMSFIQRLLFLVFQKVKVNNFMVGQFCHRDYVNITLKNL